MAKTTEGREVDKNYSQVSVSIGITSLSGSFTTQLWHKLNHNTTSAYIYSLKITKFTKSTFFTSFVLIAGTIFNHMATCWTHAITTIIYDITLKLHNKFVVFFELLLSIVQLSCKKCNQQFTFTFFTRNRPYNNEMMLFRSRKCLHTKKSPHHLLTRPTDSKVRTTLHSMINGSTEKYCLVTLTWMVTL